MQCRHADMQMCRRQDTPLASAAPASRSRRRPPRPFGQSSRPRAWPVHGVADEHNRAAVPAERRVSTRFSSSPLYVSMTARGSPAFRRRPERRTRGWVCQCAVRANAPVRVRVRVRVRVCLFKWPRLAVTAKLEHPNCCHIHGLKQNPMAH